MKALFVRPGFAEEIDTLEARTREFATRFGGKEAGPPSPAGRRGAPAGPPHSAFYPLGGKQPRRSQANRISLKSPGHRV